MKNFPAVATATRARPAPAKKGITNVKNNVLLFSAVLLNTRSLGPSQTNQAAR